MSYNAFLNTPIGIIKIIASEEKIISLQFVNKIDEQENLNCVLKEVMSQLKEYFNGIRKNFNIPLEIRGTDFQIRVWNLVKCIPYGETLSYKDIALMLGNVNYSRAVGNANNKNKFPIIIPCHRVIGSSGKLIGYSSGIEKKEWLLRLEARYKS